jgi:AbrB family looped-hinge helix DNA binding protein
MAFRHHAPSLPFANGMRDAAVSATASKANGHEYDCHMPLIMAYGIVNGMATRIEVKIDKAGRIVVPKALRERLGFRPDLELEAIEQPNGVLLKRASQRPAMVKIDGLWVHQGKGEPGAKWESVLDNVREERISSTLEA